MREPGKKRIKLAKLLTEAGFACQPSDLHAAQGWERSSNRIDNDTYRWEGWGKDKQGLLCHFYSYYTMTELVRTGVELEHSRMDVPCWYQVFPRKKE